MPTRQKRETGHMTLNVGLHELLPTEFEHIKFIDLTPHLNGVIKHLEIQNGIVNIQVKHTTAGFLPMLCVQENEEGLVRHDLPEFALDFMRKIFAWGEGRNFVHDREERIQSLGGTEPRNALSHLLARTFPCSVPGEVKDGSLHLNVHKNLLDLGTYQSVLLFVDFDAAPHHPGREISIVVERRR
ncbi:MAG: YjbQ family protein [bacterium]|nr:YjbQ family protein [bacterium]